MRIFQSHNGKGKNRVVIDGRDFIGRSIGINDDGTVYIDGERVDGTLVGPISVTIYGSIERVESVSGDVAVEGSAGSVQTTSGDVLVKQSIHGSVKTVSGDVRADAIGGSINTVSGDIIGRR